jgi:hypothetical protein
VRLGYMEIYISAVNWATRQIYGFHLDKLRRYNNNIEVHFEATQIIWK